MFGCELNGFADYYHIKNFSKFMNSTDFDEKSETYIMFYHCDENFNSKRRMIKVSLITVKSISQDFMDERSEYFEGSLPF